MGGSARDGSVLTALSIWLSSPTIICELTERGGTSLFHTASDAAVRASQSAVGSTPRRVTAPLPKPIRRPITWSPDDARIRPWTAPRLAVMAGIVCTVVVIGPTRSWSVFGLMSVVASGRYGSRSSGS